VKKFFFIFINILFLVLGASYAQTYQLPNGGFELWDGSSPESEPTHWNGFPSAACDLSGVAALGCNSATVVRHSKSTEVRPGSGGIYSLRIFATQITLLGNTIIANGAISTGQIRIGNTTPASNENYNITRTLNPKFRQAFTGKPDSISFWARFVCPSTTQQAKMIATIHSSYDYREPESSDAQAHLHVVGKAEHYFTRGNQNWKKYTIPFDYNFPGINPAYILITFTTNKVPGEGSPTDMLFVDDVEMIYNAKLNGIEVNGVPLPEFHPDSNFYNVSSACHSLPIVTATTISPNADMHITQADFNNKVSVITVSAGNLSKTYTLNFKFEKVTYVNAAVCAGESYQDAWFNLPAQNITGTHFYRFTTYTSAECDSVIQLNLTVNPNYVADTFNLMICENSVYNFFGTPLTEAGVYDTIVPSISGCDSVVVVNLSVGDYYLINIHASICEGETYTQNGFNTSSAGRDTLFFVAVNQCDSLVVLHLDLLTTHHTIIYDTIDQGMPYNAHGFSISTETSGVITAQQAFINTEGCDSIVSLNLYVIPDVFFEGDSNDFEFKIYPNPTNNYVTVKIVSATNALYVFQVFDSYGRYIMAEEIHSHEKTIDISNIRSGFYIVRLASSGNVYKTKKLIKY